MSAHPASTDAMGEVKGGNVGGLAGSVGDAGSGGSGGALVRVRGMGGVEVEVAVVVVGVRADPVIVMAAVCNNGLALQWACKELQGDRGTVLAAVASDHTALRLASAELKTDEEVVRAAGPGKRAACLVAVGVDGMQLQRAGELRSDRGVVLAALTIYAVTLRWWQQRWRIIR
ncbi:hypothetical protein B484DRAFT_415307 [Ochromonadaceae sp. CCMP2298]|nr:hypothetical protein B484DRAFT_415307 [Ochromonadaceae sp. CCMP2298]